MSWSDLQPQVRAAILGAAFILLLVFVWVWFVTPMRAGEAAARQDIVTAEAQLEQMEREIEGIAPATDGERAAWQSSQDALMSRLGPESEVPLLLESIVRLAESQGVDVFITSGASAAVGLTQQGRGAPAPSPGQQTLATIPGAAYLTLSVKIFGDYESTSRFISQLGRLGWVTDISGITLTRSFPEVATAVGLVVFFRPSDNGSDGRPGAVGVLPDRQSVRGQEGRTNG